MAKGSTTNGLALKPAEALIYTMVTMSAVDRVMSDTELRSIGSIVRRLPAFASFEESELVKTAEACGKLLGEKDGLDRVLNAVDSVLTPELKETAYALAVEIAAADASVHLEELRFLELLADKFELDDLLIAAVKRSAQLRHRKIDDPS
jgi:tellurite resistance protein